jgi:uncharacterized protein (UPF0335 family)
MSLGHNSAGGERLKLLVERIVRLEEEKAQLAADIADIYSEADGQGFDRKALRAVVKKARMSASERRAARETEELIEVYSAAIGMLDGTPLGEAARERLSRRPPPAEPGEGDRPKGGGGGAEARAEAEAPPTPKTIGPQEIAAARAAEGERDALRKENDGLRQRLIETLLPADMAAGDGGAAARTTGGWRPNPSVATIAGDA